MKIALFGGSFNPIHSEHVNIVKAAMRALSLDKIIIMPSCITPQKEGRLTASGVDRYNMCRLAFEGLDGIEVSDFELKNGGISYSYVTCREFKKKYPDAERFFIIGADMLENFVKWKNPEEILSCVKLAVCKRVDEQSLENAEKIFKCKFGNNIVKINYTGADVSSTRIRALAALGESVNGLTDEKVANYIKAGKIYAPFDFEKVKSLLTDKRWAHTVRVAVMAAENCNRAGVDEKSAIIAAALHDCAKYPEKCRENLIGFVCPDNVPEPVVHQYAGEYVARNTFKITDENILNAIKYHASGRENMTPLEKLIYLADMLEEGRNFVGVDDLRKEFALSIDGGMYAALKHQLNYLKSTNKPVYPLTERAYKYLEEKNDK